MHSGNPENELELEAARYTNMNNTKSSQTPKILPLRDCVQRTRGINETTEDIRESASKKAVLLHTANIPDSNDAEVALNEHDILIRVRSTEGLGTEENHRMSEMNLKWRRRLTVNLGEVEVGMYCKSIQILKKTGTGVWLNAIVPEARIVWGLSVVR
ncbi:hypothetical protein B0H17DRAFT_1142927 [Mycena rosella]|uniref:Uncharacterized protein n=1 Tax=Mycena rosella TaxID=1033263 RepID=A0AAD7CWN8_MYCRO|nr:hypothetical protein B0H17DRAFT_1142927 [Mycena rosella]